MPDLVEGSLPLRVKYRASLAHSVLATASLLCAAPTYEGLGVWLHKARAQMPADLRSELYTLVAFAGGVHRFTSELSACLPDDAETLDMEGLLAFLGALPGRDYQRMALRALARGASPRPSPSAVMALLDRPDAWSSYLASVESDIEPGTVAGLAGDGEQLKDRLLAALDRFWRELYAGEFEATRSLMERSVAYHRAQSYGSGLSEEFQSVTGRLVPEQIADLLPQIDTLTFVPSCYVGPYVAYSHYGTHLIVFFNCRSAPAGDGVETTDTRTILYPLLKALADETRLQIVALLSIRELYAQEIVDQLDISQPAVSRHLNLMTAAGVLETRREGNAKYYRLNRDALSRLAEGLRTFLV
ncbi:ArsR/SmtB family transcription factor [Chloroflexota bacterium]